MIVGGVCHRFPRLNIVSVESGIGWIPYLLEALDWQWVNSGVPQEHPEMDLLPSEYFKRQVYGCFWFERGPGVAAIDLVGPDNFLFESDFPHPTSMSPGPKSIAEPPLEYFEHHYGQFPADVKRKLLHDNAARVYHVD
jgi:predicted TIM-barrel fold metal-dependent hydrolase